MAWRFRRSLKLGPFRLNFSKSGIGYSAGVRGFRLGQDAKGRTYTAASIPGTGLYSRQYSGAGKPNAQDAASPGSAPPQSGMRNGLKLFIAFCLGGVVFSIAGAIISTSTAVPPTPPPAPAVSAPVVPPPVTPAKQHARSSKRTPAAGLPTAAKASHTPQAPDDPASGAAAPGALAHP
jgi:hypothetical protein